MRFPAERIVLILIIVAIALGAWYVYSKRGQSSQPTTDTSSSQTSTYDGASEGITFVYPSRYTLERREIDINAAPATYLTLTPANVQVPQGGEGPPGITVAVFGNPNKTPLADWLRTMTNATGPAPVGGWDYGDAKVAGVDGIAYTSTGLYESDNVAVAHGDNIYVFSASWMTRNDQTLKDLSSILSSVKFK